MTSRDVPEIDQNGSYELVLNSTADSLAVLDSNRRHRSCLDGVRPGERPGFERKSRRGRNYLEVCKRAARSGLLAQRAVAGIRAVLDGTRNNFRLEYPCHSPTVARFFSMSATPMKNGQGAIILHTNLTYSVRTQQELGRALGEIARPKNKLESANQYLQERVQPRHNVEDIIGDSEPLRKILRYIGLVAETASTVLLLGETGTGKERFARAIHARSARRARPLVIVDCDTFPMSTPGLRELPSLLRKNRRTNEERIYVLGHGIHFCLGAALARLEARVTREEVLKRFPGWEVDLEGARCVPSSTVSGWESLSVFTGAGEADSLGSIGSGSEAGS